MSRRLNRLPQLVANRLARIQANVDCAVLSTACAADALFAPVPTTGAGAAKPSPLVLEYPGSLCPACVLPSETGSGYVIRLHETAGRRGTASCRTCRLGDPWWTSASSGSAHRGRPTRWPTPSTTRRTRSSASW